jgi:hypothetical protein
MRGGVAALKGPAPMKNEAALHVVTPLPEAPTADRRNWTIPRLRAEIEAHAGVRVSRSQLSKALRKKFRCRRREAQATTPRLSARRRHEQYWENADDREIAAKPSVSVEKD